MKRSILNRSLIDSCRRCLWVYSQSTSAPYIYYNNVTAGCRHCLRQFRIYVMSRESIDKIRFRSFGDHRRLSSLRIYRHIGSLYRSVVFNRGPKQMLGCPTNSEDPACEHTCALYLRICSPCSVRRKHCHTLSYVRHGQLIRDQPHTCFERLVRLCKTLQE